MSALQTLNLLDLRADLPRATWSIGRQARKTSATLHYNGPAVAAAGDRAAEIQQLVADARYHMRPNAFGPGAAGDGIQYHFAILSDGTICQLRDLDAVLWHCANSAGNTGSIAIHLPLGVGQTPASIQWRRTTELFTALGVDYGYSARQQTRGHTEWPKFDGQGRQVPNSACPGDILMGLLRQWRTRAVYRVRAADGLNVRQGPSSDFPRAIIDGQPRVYPFGHVFDIDKIVEGEAVRGDPRWGHLSNGEGFVSLAWAEEVRA